MNTTSETPLLSSLSLESELNGLKNVINEAVSSDTTLRLFFKDLFRFSASNHCIYEASYENRTHPLIALNSLKNLAALRLDSPSRPIVEKAIEICHHSQASDDSLAKIELKQEELDQPLFTQDFLRAVVEGDAEKARCEAAKIAVVSGNQVAVIEMIMEVATHHMDELGTFVYGVYRSAVFGGEKEPEPFMNLLLTEVTKQPRPIETADLSGDDSLYPFLGDVLKNSDDRDFSLFSTALRLWETDSPRQSGYRKGLKLWAERQFKSKPLTEETGALRKESSANSIIKAIKDNNPSQLTHFLSRARAADDWSWTTELAESWIESFETKESDFLLLDSLQSLIKGVPESFIPLLAVRLLQVNSSISDR